MGGGRGRNYPIIKARRSPRRNTKAIFKYWEDFITATFKTVMNVTFLGLFHNRNEAQHFHSFASGGEETRRGLGDPKCSSKSHNQGWKMSPSLECSEKGWDGWRRKTESHRGVGRSIQNTLAFPQMGESSQIRAYCSNHISNEIIEIKAWSPETTVAICPGSLLGVLSICAPPKRSRVENDVCPPKWSGVENNVKEAFKTHHWDYSTF